MKNLLLLILLLPALASAQINIQGTNIQIGPKDVPGPPGCVIGSTCTADLTPQSINNTLYPSLYAGNDLAAKVFTALTSLGGTSGNPISHAHLVLPPGSSFATTTITLPNSTTAPYVSAVDFECQGATITNNSSQPIFHVLAENANGGANGSIVECSLDEGSGGTGIQVDARIGFRVEHNIFNGGSIGLKMVNTLFQDGTTQGYSEQHDVFSNDFVNQTQYGVSMQVSGGTDSFEYGKIDWTNHFQMLCGSSAISVGSGVTIQGGELSGRINTTSGSCANPTVFLSGAGSAYRGTIIHATGEDTGGLAGSGFYLFGADFTGSTLTAVSADVTGMTLKADLSNYSHTTLPSNIYTTLFGDDNVVKLDDESHGPGFALWRKGIFAIAQQNVRYWMGGEVGNNNFALYNFGGPAGIQATPQNATSVTSVMRATNVGVGLGPGYSELASDSTCKDSAGCNLPTDQLNLKSYSVTIPGTVNMLQVHAETDGMHIDNTDASNTPGQPTRPLKFGGYDNSGGPPFLIKPLANMYFTAGVPWFNVPGIIDATAGFTQGGAAPSGHCLIGNGTEYVDSASCGGGGGGSGTVTSVAVTVPSHQSVAGSPITAAGTIAITDNAQAANTFLAGPTSGASAAPTVRALAANDLPLATTGAFGAVKPDGTSITIASGVISSTAAPATGPTNSILANVSGVATGTSAFGLLTGGSGALVNNVTGNSSTTTVSGGGTFQPNFIYAVDPTVGINLSSAVGHVNQGISSVQDMQAPGIGQGNTMVVNSYKFNGDIIGSRMFFNHRGGRNDGSGEGVEGAYIGENPLGDGVFALTSNTTTGAISVPLHQTGGCGEAGQSVSDCSAGGGVAITSSPIYSTTISVNGTNPSSASYGTFTVPLTMTPTPYASVTSGDIAGLTPGVDNATTGVSRVVTLGSFTNGTPASSGLAIVTGANEEWRDVTNYTLSGSTLTLLHDRFEHTGGNITVFFPPAATYVEFSGVTQYSAGRQVMTVLGVLSTSGGSSVLAFTNSENGSRAAGFTISAGSTINVFAGAMQLGPIVAGSAPMEDNNVAWGSSGAAIYEVGIPAYLHNLVLNVCNPGFLGTANFNTCDSSEVKGDWNNLIHVTTLENAAAHTTLAHILNPAISAGGVPAIRALNEVASINPATTGTYLMNNEVQVLPYQGIYEFSNCVGGDPTDITVQPCQNSPDIDVFAFPRTNKIIYSPKNELFVFFGQNPPAFYQGLNIQPTADSTKEGTVTYNNGIDNGVLRMADNSGNAQTLALLKYLPSTATVATIASASTIAPVTGVVHITGSGAIVTITPPSTCTVTCTVTLIPDAAFTTTAAGNIALASVAIVNRTLTETYDAGTSKWYPSY